MGKRRQLKLLLVTIVTNSLLQFIDKILTINLFVEKINKFKNWNELSKHPIHECITVLLKFFFSRNWRDSGCFQSFPLSL